MNLDEFREKYPAYKNIPNDKLAEALYKKYYAGKVDRQSFYNMINMQQPAVEVEQPQIDQQTVAAAPTVAGPPASPPAGRQQSVQLTPYLSKFIDSDLKPSHAITAARNPDAAPGKQIKQSGLLQRIGESFTRPAALAAKSFNEATAGFMDRLDKMATKVSELTGLEKGGLFEAARDQYLQNAEYWNKKAGKHGLADEIVGEVIGGAIPGVIEFAMGPAYAGAVGYAEGGAGEAAKKAAERAVMGGILHGVNTLKVLPRTVLGGAVGGVQAAAEGGDAREIAKGAATLGVFSAAAGGGKKQGLREAYKDARNLRKDEKQVQGPRIERREGEREGGPDIQQPAQKEPTPGYEKETLIGLDKDEMAAAAIPKKPRHEMTLDESLKTDYDRYSKAHIEDRMDFNQWRESKLGKSAELDHIQAVEIAVSKGQKVDENILKPFYEQEKQYAQAGEIKIGGKKEPQFEFEPELEQGWKRAHGVKKPPFIENAKQWAKRQVNLLTREYEHLPKTGEFAEASFALRKLMKQRDISMEKSIKNIAEITKDLKKEDYNLFERKVFMDDMAQTASEGKSLPFELDKDKVNTELKRLDAVMTEPAKRAIERRRKTWETVKQDYIQSMKDIDFNVEKRLSRKGYFRHQILEYVNAKGLYGTGKRLKTPTKAGFLRERKGSKLDINTNYLEAEHEVMAQIHYDIEVAKTIKKIRDNYDIRNQLIKEAKEKKVDWTELIPDGYVEWQPREGNVFYMTDTIPSQMAEKLMNGAILELGITRADLNKALAIGGRRKAFVIKEELAKTLDELYRQKSTNPIWEGYRKVIKGWKVWQLISPRRYPKYNLRNITGDLDAVFTGNTSSLKKVPKAMKELYEAYAYKKMSPELQDFFDRGGMGVTLQAQEMGGINSLKMFSRMIEKRGKLEDLPFKVWSGYWKAARMSTDFRESILRYASYLDFMEKMKKNPDGLPKDFAASIPEEVKGLSDIKDRAFLMQNDLLGAYDRVSVAGQALRENIFPFWSWKEVNAKRYKQMFSNAATEGKLASTVGKKIMGTAAIKTPYRAYKIGKFLIKASALWGMLHVWNNTRYPEEEKRLPTYVRNKPHIILGKTKDGQVNYFSRLGALPDLLEWVGLDTAPEYITALSNGESPTVIAKEMAKSPVNIFLGGSVPFTKMIGEVITRRAMWPDVFKPRTIRNRALHIAKSFGIENEYIALSQYPKRKTYKQSLKDIFIYQTDPLEAAYNETFTLKYQYLKKLGKGSEGFFISAKGSALYNAKMSIRYGDKESFRHYMKKYFELGGTITGIKRSLAYMHPLYGMKKEDQDGFLKSLSKDEVMTVALGHEFYARMFDPQAQKLTDE